MGPFLYDNQQQQTGEKVIIGDIDEVPTDGLPRSFPLLTNDSPTYDSKHVSMDQTLSHYDVGPL